MDVACWKDPNDWPLGGSTEIRAELDNLLSGRLCSSSRDKDILASGLCPKGKFSVAQGYAWLDNQCHCINEFLGWKKVWNKVSWPKCNFFLWLVAQKKWLTWDNLQRRGFQGPSMCSLCIRHEENVSHLFLLCPLSKEIWHKWWEAWCHGCIHAESLIEFWDSLGRPPAKTMFLQVAWAIGPSLILWNLWLEYNQRIFCNSSMQSTNLW